MLYASERRFKCDRCVAAFPTKSKLERHQNRHHNLMCRICMAVLRDPALYKGIYDKSGTSNSLLDPNERFENFNELRKHMKEHHPMESELSTTMKYILILIYS